VQQKTDWVYYLRINYISRFYDLPYIPNAELQAATRKVAEYNKLLGKTDFVIFTNRGPLLSLLFLITTPESLKFITNLLR
jgi:hypothetical protein